ncbi:hypothetical protein DWUX_156 [Desulfovibrio diazotrophicus]|nr:hypothetical protein DWUX_156 [Desulfovibrio diazotrophicus]
MAQHTDCVNRIEITFQNRHLSMWNNLKKMFNFLYQTVSSYFYDACETNDGRAMLFLKKTLPAMTGVVE